MRAKARMNVIIPQSIAVIAAMVSKCFRAIQKLGKAVRLERIPQYLSCCVKELLHSLFILITD